MSIAIAICRAQLGLEAPVVQVEVSLGPGLPVFAIVGLPATVVKESKDRVRAAIVNSNFKFPAGRITVNLSPADIPKRGGRFDLPIAVGILLASGQLIRHSTHGAHRIELYGELGLTGELKPVPGILLAAAHAAHDGHEVILPQANTEEVRLLLTASANGTLRTGPVMRAADHLLAVCAHLNATTPLPILSAPPAHANRWVRDMMLDLSDVRGQVQAKRALTIAAAGGHSLLMVGPPGAGKTMLAMRLPGLLPPMTEAESLEVATIASVSGPAFNAGDFGRRPVRIPHHTASAVALIGGGSGARPGEISLAHHGVLFLDELLEYDRRALEALREPLESGVVCIARAARQTRYPAEFQLVAAMNPCPCGRLGDPRGTCACTPAEVARYRARVSAPLMERFDLHLEVPNVDLDDFDENRLPRETSAATAARVTRARAIQLSRQGKCNARLADAQVERVCALDSAGRLLLEQAMKQLGLSARSRQRVVKLARTIADLAEEKNVSAAHIGEAITFRGLDRRPHVAGTQTDGAPAPTAKK